MIVYHGTFDSEFLPNEFVNNRYGFVGVFCSPDRELAEKYAEFYKYHNKGYRKKGFLFQLEVPDKMKRFDYKGKITYALEFRNLIYQIRDKQLPIAMITNCYDYPCRELEYYAKNDIVLVMKPSLIKNTRLIKEIK